MKWADLRELAGDLGLTTSTTSPAHRPMRPRRHHLPNPVEHRPASLVEMVGQDRARALLTIHVRGAAVDGLHPGHILLYGPPGTGKTSLAELVAKLANPEETPGQLVRTVGSILNSPEVLMSTLGKLRTVDQQGRPVVDVVIIDEVHRLPPKIAELLYMAMEDGRVEYVTGRGQNKRIESIKLPPFILVAATTLPGYLEQPFRDRFELALSLEYYSVEELLTIVTAAAQRQGVTIEPDAALLLAERARATPRVALRLLKTAKNFARTFGGREAPITVETVTRALDLAEIDKLGLDRDDRAMLLALCQKHRGGPIGRENLSAASGIDVRTIEEAIEPFLIRIGLLARTPRGRVATELAFDHLNEELGLELECPAHLRTDNAHGEPWAD